MLVASESALGAFPGANGRIAFSHSFYAGEYVPPDCDSSACSVELEPTVLETVRPGGAGRKELRTCRRRRRCSHTNPAFSPNGRRLVFDNSGGEIFGGALLIARANGSKQKRVALPTDQGAYEPAWSPDGERLVYVGQHEVPNPENPGVSYLASDLFTIRPDGSDVRRLTPPSGVLAGEPNWSTNGWIAFTRGDPDTAQLWMVRPDGSRLTKLTGKDGFSPSWSPDGKQIAFSRGSAPESQRIHVLEVESGRVERITTDIGFDPSWSPNGLSIAYACERGICVVPAEGGQSRLIVRVRGYANYVGAPDWRPVPRR